MSLSIEAARDKDRRNGLSPMEHRHFATIATIIAALANDEDTDKYNVAHHFAGYLNATNPRFDRARFLRACGV